MYSVLSAEDVVREGDEFRLSWMEPDEWLRCELFVGHRAGGLYVSCPGLSLRRPSQPTSREKVGT